MILLIDKDTVSTYSQLAVGLNETEVNKFILESQDYDLKELVCEKFFIDLLNKKDSEDTEWVKAYAGGEYTYDSFSYRFDGLNKVLALFTMSRIVMDSSIQSTSFGMKKKTTPNSTELEFQEKKDKAKRLRIEANQIFRDFENYMNRMKPTTSSFTNWECGDCEYKSNRIKTRVIK